MSLKNGGGNDDRIGGRSWRGKLHLRSGWEKRGRGGCMGSDGGEESGKGRKEPSVDLCGDKFKRNNLETPRGGFGSPARKVGALALALPINMLCDLGHINQPV